MATENLLSLIGIIITLIVSVIGLIVGIRNTRKTIFVNSITSSRIQYIQDVRNSISEYCGLFYRYKILLDNDSKLSNEKLEVLKSIDKLKYQIMLYLNPEDRNWDQKIITLVIEIRERINENPEDKIKDLIEITQYLLKLEWDGAKLESKNGDINELQKNKLSNDYFKKYIDQKEKDLK